MTVFDRTPATSTVIDGAALRALHAVSAPSPTNRNVTRSPSANSHTYSDGAESNPSIEKPTTRPEPVRFVFPRRGEGFGLKLADCGRPARRAAVEERLRSVVYRRQARFCRWYPARLPSLELSNSAFVRPDQEWVAPRPVLTGQRPTPRLFPPGGRAPPPVLGRRLRPYGGVDLIWNRWRRRLRRGIAAGRDAQPTLIAAPACSNQEQQRRHAHEEPWALLASHGVRSSLIHQQTDRYPTVNDVALFHSPHIPLPST